MTDTDALNAVLDLPATASHWQRIQAIASIQEDLRAARAELADERDETRTGSLAETAAVWHQRCMEAEAEAAELRAEVIRLDRPRSGDNSDESAIPVRWQWLVAILLDKLGGEVVLTEKEQVEIEAAPEFVVFSAPEFTSDVTLRRTPGGDPS